MPPWLVGFHPPVPAQGIETRASVGALVAPTRATCPDSRCRPRRRAARRRGAGAPARRLRHPRGDGAPTLRRPRRQGGRTRLSVDLFRPAAGLAHRLVPAADGADAAARRARGAGRRPAAAPRRDVGHRGAAAVRGPGRAAGAGGLGLPARDASIALALLSVGAVIWLFERRRDADMSAPLAARGLGDGFRCADATPKTIGVDDKTPVTALGCGVAMLSARGAEPAMRRARDEAGLDLVVRTRRWDPGPIAMAFPPGDPLRAAMDRALLQVMASEAVRAVVLRHEGRDGRGVRRGATAPWPRARSPRRAGGARRASTSTRGGTARR